MSVRIEKNGNEFVASVDGVCSIAKVYISEITEGINIGKFNCTYTHNHDLSKHDVQYFPSHNQVLAMEEIEESLTNYYKQINHLVQ